MATAPVQLDEEALIRQLIGEIEMPTGVKLSRIDQVFDWSGEPALRIYFSIDVSRKNSTAPRQIAALAKLTRTVEEKILETPITKWPYFSFLEVK